MPIDWKRTVELRKALSELADGQYTDLIIQKAMRSKPELAGIDGSSLPQLKARYEIDKEFQKAIDGLLQEPLPSTGSALAHA